MIGQMSSARYDPLSGRIKVKLISSTANGYGNTVDQYSPYGIMSVPNSDVLINLDRQALTQVVATGYNNTILDVNFSINAGEISLYSNNWYNHTANSGIFMQPRNTAFKENAVMGQSTNKVLKDIMELLINIITYLDTHVHTGVTSGGANSGPPLNPAPDNSTVVTDNIYIGANKNLAITGTYEPK